MKNSLADGIYDDLSFVDYHNDSAVGSSTLKTIISKSPAHAKVRSSISKEVADFGTAVHCAILEPEKFEKTILRGPDNRRGKQWSDPAAEAEINGQVLLTSGDYDEVLEARDGVYRCATAKELLSRKLAAERSLFWTDRETGIRLKARPDLITTDGLIVDVKTTKSAHPESFMRDVLSYGYHIQEAHYTDGAFATHEGNFIVHGFVFLAIEKQEPWASAVYRLDAASVREGLNIRNMALMKYKQCVDVNHWPAYDEGIKELRIPDFGFKTVDLEAFDADSHARWDKPSSPA